MTALAFVIFHLHFVRNYPIVWWIHAPLIHPSMFCCLRLRFAAQVWLRSGWKHHVMSIASAKFAVHVAIVTPKNIET